MKKFILLALTALMMMGCGDYEGKNQKSVALTGYSDVEIDSCNILLAIMFLLTKEIAASAKSADKRNWKSWLNN